jgi:hypothetical protein
MGAKASKRYASGFHRASTWWTFSEHTPSKVRVKIMEYFTTVVRIRLSAIFPFLNLKRIIVSLLPELLLSLSLGKSLFVMNKLF